MFELRLLISRQRSEQKRKLTVRSRSLPPSHADPPPPGRLLADANDPPPPCDTEGADRWPGALVDDPGEVFYWDAPTSLPSGATAYQVPPTP